MSIVDDSHLTDEVVSGHICASCCDAEYTSELKCALETAIDLAEAAEKQISELAAREVDLPTFNIPVRWGPAMICVDMTEIKKRCVDAIRAAGIGVKGE